MSEENVELVRKGFEAYSARGIEALLDFATEDGVWHTAPEFIDAPEFRGHEGLRSLFSVFTDHFDDWTVDVIEVRDAGDSVVALIEHGGMIKGTDTPLRQPMGVVFSDFRHGRAGRFDAYQTWREALQAAGLPE
jgi:ketosteroid isomerase-like protein